MYIRKLKWFKWAREKQDRETGEIHFLNKYLKIELNQMILIKMYLMKI